MHEKTRQYGVRLVRGPVHLPEAHPLAREDERGLKEMLRTALAGKPRAADLFCGAGGLSLGLEQAGYAVVLGVDSDPEAVLTHRSLAPGLTTDWDLSLDENVEQVGRLVRELDIELLAGGPPCQPFSKAGRSMLRHLVDNGKRDPEDLRAGLWQSFLRVIELGRPRAVLMENVPDMVLDRDMLVLRTMVDELEGMGYSVDARLIGTYRYGVPQHRQRLLLVALAGGAAFTWPGEVPEAVNVRQAIGDLPPVQGGWRPDGGDRGWLEYRKPEGDNPFVAEMRRYVAPDEEARVYDHVTRPVREDDARAFAFMGPGTKYSDLPDELKRYRDDIFDDKYKRLDWDDLSRTITAHIAKDGYWYIHPEQDRTLTVREAARIQTFPDDVRFAGSPTAAFRQIGNAVPVRVGFHMGTAIRAALKKPRLQSVRSRDLSHSLSSWIEERHTAGEIADPRVEGTVSTLVAGDYPPRAQRWLVLMAQIVLARLPNQLVRDGWSVMASALATPEDAQTNDATLSMLGKMLKRESRLDEVREIRDALIDDPEALATPESMERLPSVTRSLARVVCRLVPGEDSDPIEASAPILRLAARFWGTKVHQQDKLSDGRLAVARLVGVDDEAADAPRERFNAALAHVALFELAEQICTATAPRCERCPLQAECVWARTHGRFQAPLPLTNASR